MEYEEEMFEDYLNGNHTYPDDDGDYELNFTSIKAFLVVLILISILILFGNSLVLAIVVKFPQLRTVTNVQIVNLSCADMLLGISMVVYGMSIFLGMKIYDSTVISCMMNLTFSCMIFSTTSSGFFLLSISVDRFIAIVNPYNYQMLMSKTRTAVICLFIWVYSFLWVAFPFFGFQHWVDRYSCKLIDLTVVRLYTSMFVIHWSITIVILIALYCKMYKIAAQKTHEIQLLKLVVMRKDSTDSSLSERCHSDSVGRRNSNYTFTRNVKAAKTVSMVVGIYSVCVIPFVLGVLMDGPMLHVKGNWLEIFENFALFLLTLNSAINPLIYHLRNSEFRLAFKKILCVKPSYDYN